MRIKSNFCGNIERCSKVLSFGKTQIHLVFRSLTRTFATIFMVATAITIVSCSQDDDDYNSDMYTLAEKMETRSGGDPGGGGGYTPTPIRIPNDTIETTYEFTFNSIPPYDGVKFTAHILTRLYRNEEGPVADIISYTPPYYMYVVHQGQWEYQSYNGILNINGIYFEHSESSPLMYEMCASASLVDTLYVGKVENCLFY